MLRPGLLLACLTLSLTACAGRQIVRTETVQVSVPVFVPLSPELTAPVRVPYLPAGPMFNEDLQALAEARGAALGIANQQLSEIRKLQPKEAAR